MKCLGRSCTLTLLFSSALLATPLSAVPPSVRAIDELAEDYLARREARGFDLQLET